MSDSKPSGIWVISFLCSARKSPNSKISHATFKRQAMFCAPSHDEGPSVCDLYVTHLFLGESRTDVCYGCQEERGCGTKGSQ